MPDRPTAPARVRELVEQLTLDEKAALTAGVDMWHGHDVERLGVTALKVSDGPAGVRGDRWVGTTSACAPCASALGATWNTELLEQVGVVIGEEARTKAVDIVLAPTVNLHRNALGGRNFECFSEDPHLTASAATAIIVGIQSTGVGACVKHFVANDSEFERHTISSDVDEPTLRELYLVPFEAAVTRADVVAVMSAYNRLNGTYCAQHRWLLTEVLRDEWGFEGIVMSDWWGTKAPESAEAGLDLEMPGPPVHLGPLVAQRVRDTSIDEDVVDLMATRLLSVAERLGVLDLDERPAERSVDVAAHREVLHRAAVEAIVLLRNEPVGDRPVLPLDPAGVASVAVIGPAADVAAALGGGSAAVNPHHVVTVLDGLRDRLGDVELRHEIGVDASVTAPPIDVRRLRPARAEDGADGLTLEYFANRSLAGDPVFVERVASPRLSWIGDEPAPGVRGGDFSARVRGSFVADTAGSHTFTLISAGTGGRLRLDGATVIDNFADPGRGTTFFGLGSQEVRATVELGAGQEVELEAELVSFDGLGAAGLLLGHVPPIPDDGLGEAARAAADADVAIVVVGLDQDSETEGRDRDAMSLPGGQDELVRAVVAANPATVVVVNAGSVVDLDCAAGAAAVLQTWYLGQETGDAVADVLVGRAAPSGRLPMTYGRRVEDWPSWPDYPGADGHVRYSEGLLMGYRGFDRRGVEPRFCFGHGLSYSTFEWSDVLVDGTELAIAGTDPVLGEPVVTIAVDVTNTGEVESAEVVQCYVHDPSGGPDRPEQELRGFTKVALAPGDSTTAQIRLDARAFARWDQDEQRWRVPEGRFEVRVGASSRDIRGRVELTVTRPD